MEGTVFTPCLEGMKHVKTEEGVMLTKPFLDVCKLILPVIDKFGAAMALVKSDIGGNITRLESKYSSNPTEFNHLFSMVQIEIEAKTSKASSSCTNGLLWLTRAMDFLVELFRDLLEHPDWTMPQACTDSYQKTLKKWHGWLASTSFTVAMKLAPDRKKFMDVIGGTGDLNADIEKFCSTFSPFLEENHKFLASVGLDNLKASKFCKSEMTTTMKGLLKGLRFISQIFENESDEKEMQIGYPTDVKHVGHIGWTGGPTMNEFNTNPKVLPAPSSTTTLGDAAKETVLSKQLSKDANGISESSQEGLVREKDARKGSRRQTSGTNASLSSKSRTKDVQDGPKHSRRHNSAGASVNSPRRELVPDGDETRAMSRLANCSSTESPSQDVLPLVPKQSRKKKSKGSTGGGSSRSRMKACTSSAYTSPFSDQAYTSSDYDSPVFSDPGPG
ncbi:hypothetical protein GIB67_037647 [Kingdonia uniflora]|uniref:CRIB domain-containing protein n=1 Tax=Kingdonia uniflora TaxID=39325 RepID=A0A7J7LSV5_9MAGN|nr:hypothetical protein GIB67_037647 [Kingdonia uniflora]